MVFQGATKQMGTVLQKLLWARDKEAKFSPEINGKGDSSKQIQWFLLHPEILWPMASLLKLITGRFELLQRTRCPLSFS
jgi:hypothetical protein